MVRGTRDQLAAASAAARLVLAVDRRSMRSWCRGARLISCRGDSALPAVHQLLSQGAARACRPTSSNRASSPSARSQLARSILDGHTRRARISHSSPKREHRSHVGSPVECVHRAWVMSAGSWWAARGPTLSCLQGRQAVTGAMVGPSLDADDVHTQVTGISPTIRMGTGS